MHYFFEDLIGLAAATALSLLLIVLPGFGIAQLMAKRGLIGEDGPGNTCWGLLLGPTLLPAADALLLRWLGMGGIILPHLALAAFGARPALHTVRRMSVGWSSLIAACWLLAAWANVDFDWAGRLNQPTTVLDGVKHAAVVAAIARDGLPMHDPFFARPGIAGYYYYFYVGPAVVHWVGGSLIDARAAFAAGSFVALLAFPALLILIAEAASFIPDGARRRFVRLTVALCFLSGLDLLAGLWIWLKTGHMLTQLDWWSEEVRWALTSVLWEPHHMTAVMAVFTGCLIVARANRSDLAPWAALAGFAFATAFGCSLWVALGAAPILGMWWLYEWVKRSTVSAWALPLSGAVALLLSLVQIGDILAGRAAAGFPLALYMRPLGPVRVLPNSVAEWIVHLVVTPGGYLVEFGIFALGAVTFLARGGLEQSRATPIGRLLLVAAPLTLLMVTFLRSAIMYNDFGWRAVWLAQLPAMVWTAAVLSSPSEKAWSSIAWKGAAALGLAAVAWDLAGMRLIRPTYVPTYINEHPEVDFAERGAYRWIDRNLPAGVIVQHNPAQATRAFDFGLYGDRPVGVADGDARMFGADEAAVQARLAAITPIYNRPMPQSELIRRASAAGVGGLLLTSADPLWRSSGGPPPGWVCQYRSAHACVVILGDLQ